MLDGCSLHSRYISSKKTTARIVNIHICGESVSRTISQPQKRNECDHFYSKMLKMVISRSSRRINPKSAKIIFLFVFFFLPPVNLCEIMHTPRSVLDSKLDSPLLTFLIYCQIANPANFIYLFFLLLDDVAFDQGKWPLLNCFVRLFISRRKRKQKWKL